MLIETNLQSLPWAEKTMSVLQQRRLEACEDRLSSLPPFGLFSGCSDGTAEILYDISLDAQEHPFRRKLHTAKDLVTQVLTNMPAEAALLSAPEHMLLERLIAMGGQCEILHPGEAVSVELLVRRLWCTCVRIKDHLLVHMPRQLMIPLTQILASPLHQELREKLMQYEFDLFGHLYLGGMLHYRGPLHHIMHHITKDTYACNEALILRYLRTTFDYTYDRSGDMLLLHPGLAEPERLGEPFQPARWPDLVNENTLMDAEDGLLPDEVPMYEMMYGLIHQVVRPGIDGYQAVEDLMLLAKQGVSLQEMYEVLPTLLTVSPTEDMREVTKQIYLRTPRWGSLRTALVH